jgi:L-threonylcarbamoyladenylate synthase
MILPGHSPESIAACVRALRAGELIGLPTETVYGLGADASSDTAVARIFAAKGRPADHPLIVHVADDAHGAAGVARFARDVPAFAHSLMQSFWPGPLTLILPRRDGVGAAAAGGQNSIGLRCPSHPLAQAVLRACLQTQDAQGAPVEPVWGIAAPSANKFGRVSPTTAQHVQAEFGDTLLILDGGPCDVGIESTIIDCTRGVPVLLRPGQVTREQIQRACGLRVVGNEELVSAAGALAPRASGTLEAHYAPRAKVRLMTAQALQTALDLLGADIDQAPPTIAVYSRAILSSRSSKVLRRRMPDDAQAVAQQLFAVLREFDDQHIKLIWVETPPDEPAWEGVRDRLRRAAAA